MQPSSGYVWRKAPLSQHAWNDSSKVYGYRKLHDNLLEQCKTCCPKLLARVTRIAAIKAQIGYKRR